MPHTTPCAHLSEFNVKYTAVSLYTAQFICLVLCYSLILNIPFEVVRITAGPAF
jgi:hypothetical protein